VFQVLLCSWRRSGTLW